MITAHMACRQLMYLRIRENGIPPDHITFVSVLSCCSHNGLVEQGHRYFDSMTRVHKITPQNEHYACIVDNLTCLGEQAF
jgi:pentatricopeptide repeat protein